MDNLTLSLHLDSFGFLAFQANGLLAFASPFIGLFLSLSAEHPKFGALGNFEAIGESQFGTVLHETETDSSQDIGVCRGFGKVEQGRLQTHIERISMLKIFLLERRIADGVGVLAVTVLHSEGDRVELALISVDLVFHVGVARFVLEGFTGHTQPAWN